MLFRKAELGQVDIEARTVPVVLATDYPVTRNGYTEVLDISRADLSRGDLPLIESHDANTLNIGVIRSIQVDGGKLRGLAVFGTSARASEVLADVQAGIVTGVSIGYQLTDEGRPIAINGLEARKFGFMPYEASAVAVPADPTAGFFRSRPTLSLKKPQGPSIMENNNTPDIRNHAQEISAIAAGIPGGADLAMRAIQEGKTIEQFQQIAIRALSTSPVPVSDFGGMGGSPAMNTRKVEPMKALRTAQDFRAHYRTEDAPMALSAFLRGVARMKTTPDATRALSQGTDTAGGYAVPRIVMPEILAALVPASSLLSAGAGIVPLSDGAKDYSFAAVDTLPVASWRFENGDVAESEPTFKQIVVTPRSLAFVVRISRELLADGANVESALQIAIAQAFAKETDRVGLRGLGVAPEPRGLLNTAGINTVTNGAAGAVLAGYGNLFSGVQASLQADAGMPTAAIMAPRSLVKLGALVDTTGQPLMVPTMLKDVQLLSSSQIPVNLTVGASPDCSEIYLGDFSKMIFGMRESLNIQLLEEHYALNGQIGFLCHVRMDVAVLYPKAFTLVTGVR
ncbi:MAG: phage major capsid protein [Burkholderiaceae bacterium]|nr:phage major capsid protein [Burkholderiaceae bacterium]